MALAGRVRSGAKDAFLSYGGKEYRGDLRVAEVGGGVQLVDVVGLEAYLLGVVPGEMPKDWPLAALEAQAVAARTYAVATSSSAGPSTSTRTGVARSTTASARRRPAPAGRPRERADPHLRRRAGADLLLLLERR